MISTSGLIESCDQDFCLDQWPKKDTKVVYYTTYDDIRTAQKYLISRVLWSLTRTSNKYYATFERSLKYILLSDKKAHIFTSKNPLSLHYATIKNCTLGKCLARIWNQRSLSRRQLDSISQATRENLIKALLIVR